MPHTHTHTQKSEAPLQRLHLDPRRNFLLWSIQKSLHNSRVSSRFPVTLAQVYTPQHGPPSPAPRVQDVIWNLLINLTPPASVGLPLIQKVSVWEA